jgi:hypothetical protein
LGLTFFGLTSKYREYLFTKIHEICFYGQGGYDWNTIYNLPIMYRELIYHKIREHYDKQKVDAEKQQKMIQSKTATTVKPPIKSDYTAKAPRK